MKKERPHCQTSSKSYRKIVATGTGTTHSHDCSLPWLYMHFNKKAIVKHIKLSELAALKSISTIFGINGPGYTYLSSNQISYIFSNENLA